MVDYAARMTGLCELLRFLIRPRGPLLSCYCSHHDRRRPLIWILEVVSNNTTYIPKELFTIHFIIHIFSATGIATRIASSYDHCLNTRRTFVFCRFPCTTVHAQLIPLPSNVILVYICQLSFCSWIHSWWPDASIANMDQSPAEAAGGCWRPPLG